jgi:serine/threonine-protein kinase
MTRQDDDERALAATTPSAPEPVVSVRGWDRGATPSLRPVRASSEGWTLSEDRYDVERLLGRGGMGEVQLALDRRLGRRVALKTIRRDADLPPAAVDRFLREVRVQGQLEHTSIVPVYDLAQTAEGTLYFTMKHVRGRTMRSILEALRDGDPDLGERYKPRKLLAAFSSVCQAIAFAHSRGVIHRDLKPENVMLGDFGEVYVLDWGIAKLREAVDADFKDSVRLPQSPATSSGAVLGSIGYMAPEQMRSSESVDARADVYALGAILFELLTLEPLHSGGTEERIADRLLGVGPRSDLALADGDVPPELSAVCMRATSRDPSERYASAHELHQAIDRHLDNDRDVELRRELATRHARVADAAADRALRGAPDDDDRRTALRSAARALALDPANRDALGVMMRLLAHPPREVPPAVQKQTEDNAAARTRTLSRAAAAGYMSLFGYLPLLLWMGVRDYGVLICLYTVIVLVSIAVVRVCKYGQPGRAATLLLLSLNALMLGATSWVVGPFLVVPGFAAATTMAYAMNFDRYRVQAIVLGCLPVLVPPALEWSGLVGHSYVFQSGGLLLVPRMTELPATATSVFLVMTSITIIVLSTLLVIPWRNALLHAEKQLVLQAWQLQHLVPDDKPSERPPPRTPSTRPTRANTTRDEEMTIAGNDTIRTNCPGEETVLDFISGVLPADAARRLEVHIDECIECRTLISSLAGARPTRAGASRPTRSE